MRIQLLTDFLYSLTRYISVPRIPEDHDLTLEKALLKSLQDPQNVNESWLAYSTFNSEALEKIELKRKFGGIGKRRARGGILVLTLRRIMSTNLCGTLTLYGIARG